MSKKIEIKENEYGTWKIVTEQTEQGQIITLSRGMYWSFDERKTKTNE